MFSTTGLYVDIDGSSNFAVITAVTSDGYIYSNYPSGTFSQVLDTSGAEKFTAVSVSSGKSGQYQYAVSGGLNGSIWNNPNFGVVVNWNRASTYTPSMFFFIIFVILFSFF